MTRALADFTTLGLGGRARSFVSAATEAELIAAVKTADAAAEPVLLIGGGSNLVISDEGFPGTVIHVNTRGIGYGGAAEGVGGAEGAVDVTVAAGEDWDGVVATTVAEGLAGLESLSGIPGRAGATIEISGKVLDKLDGNKVTVDIVAKAGGSKVLTRARATVRLP